MDDERPVAALLAERIAAGSRPGHRTDRARLALVVEGGGMRGAITGGMVLGLHELGALPGFDAIYGASAGALNGTWMVSGDPRPGLEAWWDAGLHRSTMRRSNLLRRRPIVDGAHLVEVVYERVVPLDTDAVLASPVTLHPVATDVATGRAVDLHPMVQDKRTLQLALRASTCLPLLSGAPVLLEGRRYLDAGIAEAVPVASAIRAGATHVLVLRSRAAGDIPAATGKPDRLVGRYLRRFGPELAAAWQARPQRAIEEDRERPSDAGGGPAVQMVRPPPGSPTIGRLERDSGRVRAGFAAGRDAVDAAVAPAIHQARAASS